MESAESFNALGPMPPAAWELVSLWSEVWDAPRFRGQERVQHAALSREAILPLLKLAASCVVALQQQLKGKTVQHGAYGASRELLVAAMDGGENGPRALADPHGRPGDFVRGLSKAAFMTGDGEYSEGLSESQLDQLLDELCTSQLEQAASLVRDPSATLRVAMEKLTAAVEEVLASPPEEGDLAAVAQRLMLVQRLERAAEDASAMLKDAGSSSTEVESSQAVDTSESTMEPMEESGDVHNGHGRSDAEDKENPLKRTKSQVAAKLKVQKVKEHQENMLKEVYDLSRTTSALSKRDVDDESEKLHAELAAVEEARKKARNFGEDLLEDMMALDNLSGLAAEDRTTRKATLSGIEGLLQDVDTAKSRLAMLHRQLEGKLQKAEDIASKKRQAKELAKLAANEKARQAHAAPEVPEAEAAPQKAAAPALEPPAPGKGVWEKVRLPLRFTSREEPGSYVISATVPGLDLEDLKLELGDASTTLLVEGLRIPSKKESALMRKRIAQKIRHVAQTSPEKFAMLAKAIPEVSEDAYLELGQGEFGRFAETFRLPKDVDVENIEASYTDGVLRIVLPKIQVQPQTDGRFLPTGHPARLRRAPQAPQGHPGLGRGAAGPWGGSLFGGHDDFFRW